MIDVYYKAAIKTGNVPMIIDKSRLREVRQYMTATWLKKSSVGVEDIKRLLTWQECWEGVEGADFLSSLNLKSSTGAPWKFIAGTSTKTFWFGTYENPKGYDSPQMIQLKETYDKQLNQLKQGKRLCNIVIEELKMERILKEKVAAGKTRIFNMADVIVICIGKTLFGGFVNKIMNDRIFNGSSIGINKWKEFQFLAQYLREVAEPEKENIVAGDFSNFDGTLNPCFLKMFVDVANAYYQDDYALARRAFVHDLIYSYRLRGNTIFSVLSGQPSGNYLTTILNTFYNNATVVYIYLNIMPPQYSSITHFKDLVRMVAYGDDNLISIHSTITDYFNMHTISKGFKELLNMTYTDETKLGIGVPFKPLSDCHFLQCKFLFNERDNQIVGVRNKERIYETLYWYNSKNEVHEQVCANVEATTLEMLMYPENEYNEFVDKLTQILHDKGHSDAILHIQNYHSIHTIDLLSQRYKNGINFIQNPIL